MRSMLFGTVLAVALASPALAATPSQIVARHVACMKAGALAPIMNDYAADAVVVTPKGLVAGQKPADGPGVYSGRTQAQRVFATLTDKAHHGGIKTMQTSIEPSGPDSVILHWTQYKGQPQQVTGQDVFVVRNNKIVYQAIFVDP